MFRFSALPRHRRRIVTRVLMVGTLVGCLLASSPAVRAQRAAGPVTITYWNQWVDPVQKGAILKVIALFEKSHPTIRVHEVDISNDQKILTAISGGRPPDAATMWNLPNLGEWAARGAIVNLDPMIKATHTDLSDYTSSSLSMSSYRGHLYGLPIELDDFALYINRDIFRAAGLTTVPKTMGELAALAVKLTNYDTAGRITQLGLGPSTGGEWLLLNIVPYFNGRWYDAAHNAVTPDNPGVLRALEWEKALIGKVGVQAYANFVTAKARNPIGDLFMDGRIAMAIDGEWMCKLIPAYNKKLHWAVFPPPYANGHPEWKNSTWVAGAIDIIPSAAPHPNEAFQFIKFIGGTQAQVILNGTWNSVPVVKSASAVLSHGCQKLFIDLAKGPRAFPWPVLPVANEYQTQLGTVEDQVIRGKANPQQAMAQLKQRIQAALTAAQH